MRALKASIIFGLCLTLAAYLMPVSGASPDLTLYLVRHGEKQAGEDPALTPEGKARAMRLAALMEAAGVERVYSTDTKRTRETTAPTAEGVESDVVIYDADKADAFASMLKSQRGVVLVVGHSNTIPGLASALTGRDEGDEFDESQYDSLYRIEFNAKGEPVSYLMSYDALERALAE